MTFSAKIKLQYNSKWEQTRGIYDDEMIPEENIIFEVPAEDLNSIQLFRMFRNFMLAIGHNQQGIDKGALSIVFSEERDIKDMRKVAEEYDLKLSEDYRDEVCKLEAEVRDLKAKLSRLEQPDNPNYTDEEIDAMTEEIIQEAFQPALKTLQNAEVVCHDCGSNYGEYSVGCSSTWEGKCGVCGQTKGVTEVRDYGYLNKGIRELSK